MIKRKIKKCQLGQNGIPVIPTSMWNTNVPNFNNPYITTPLVEEDDWHHNVDNIDFPGYGMTPLDPKDSKYFSSEELSGSTGEEKSKIKRRRRFGFNPQMYANLQGLNGIVNGIGNIYEQGQQAQNRVDMSPLSGLQYSNGRSDQSKYGYSFQKGGYTVKKGDNLTEIAKKYNIPLNDLLKVNYIQNRDLIYPGQSINIPKTNSMSASLGLEKPKIKLSATTGISKEKPSGNMSAELGNSYPKAKMTASTGIPNSKQNIISSSASLGLPANMSAYIGDPNRKNVGKASAELSPFPTFKLSGSVGDPNKVTRSMYEKEIFSPNFSYDFKKFMNDPNIPQLVKDMYNKEIKVNTNKRANIVDKANNTQYITQKDGTIKPLQVITGKNPFGDYIDMSAEDIDALKEKDKNKFKVTPEGKFAYTTDVSAKDLNEYNNNIYAFNNSNVAQHQMYDPKVRSKWMNTGNPKDRYGSFGCVNCSKEDFEKHIKTNFSPKDSILILNSDKSFDHYEKEYKKNRKLESGGYSEDEDDFLFGDESNYKQNNAEESERLTAEEVVEETSKRRKYDFTADPLGLFGKINRRVRKADSQEEFTDYEPAQTNTTENQSFAFNYLQQQSLQPHQAAGIVGNFTQESNMNPGITNSIGAFGAGQWLGPRKKALIEFAKSKGQDPANLQTQLDFTLHELQTTEKRAGNALAKTQTTAEAAKVFRKMYERPGEKEANDKRRIQEAKKLHPYQDGGILKKSNQLSNWEIIEY